MFLDSVSQRSFIIDKLAKILIQEGIYSGRKKDVFQLTAFAIKRAVIHRPKKEMVEVHLENGTRKKLHLRAFPRWIQHVQDAEVEPQTASK